MTFTFIDLFCGIGGFHQALSQLGGRCVFASDIDKNCREVYENNYGLKPHGDITKVSVQDIPDHDVLVGGFPCQAHSNAGHKKAFDDSRGKLFDEIIRIAAGKKPKMMLLENVKHIKKVKDGTVYQYIYDQLDKIGYSVQDVEVSPHQMGIPQLRPRVYFMCIRKDVESQNIAFSIDSSPSKNYEIFENNQESTQPYKLSDELCRVIDAWNEILQKMDKGQKISVPILLDEFWKNYESMDGISGWKQTYIKKNQELYEKYKPHFDEWYHKYKDLLSKKSIYSKLEWQTGELKGNDSIWDYFIQVRQSGIRVKRNDNFPTLVAIVQVPIYGKERRFLTPRECARLQSFPDDFVLHPTDKTAYKQLGNGVNVDAVKMVMQHMLNRVNL
jgi:DNA (cytosine-5)-methyltransferase 1